MSKTSEMARMQNLIAMETDQPYIDMLALDMVLHISGYGAHSTACSWRRQTQIDIHANWLTVTLFVSVLAPEASKTLRTSI